MRLAHRRRDEYGAVQRWKLSSLRSLGMASSPPCLSLGGNSWLGGVMYRTCNVTAAVLLSIFGVLALEAHAQQRPAPYAPRVQPEGPMSFDAVIDKKKPTVGSVFVAPDQVEDVKLEPLERWPATYHAVNPFSCTATLVGSRTALTAAHCIGKDPRIELRQAGVAITGRCTVHPSYNRTWAEDCRSSGKSCSTSYDLALCYLDRAPSVGRHERLSASAQDYAIGGVVFLVGFGCIYKDGTGGSVVKRKPDGTIEKAESVLHSGWAQIVSTFSGVNDYVTTTSKISGTTLPTRSGANVCPGDSGGLAYLAARSDTSIRRGLAVHSRVDGVFDAAGNIVQVTGPSFLSTVSSAATRDFMLKWAKEPLPGTGSTDICGITATADPRCPPL